MGAPSGATTYLYNQANQLTHADGITHTWDANRNLLHDGVYTYTYDYENRLTAVSNQVSATSFEYNGLGERYRGVENGETITYTLDLASGLPQVLADGRHTYLYGLGRIAQQDAGGAASFFLPDALGSVRQMAGAGGNVLLAQSFDPFGNLLSSQGALSSPFGYAGEWTLSGESSPTGLQYLRARYYSPLQGRFLTRDPFPGLLGLPATQHPYAYALNNPVMFTDPSGLAVKEFPIPGPDYLDWWLNEYLPQYFGISTSYSTEDGFCIGGCCSGGATYAEWWKTAGPGDKLVMLWGWNLSGSTPGRYWTGGQEEVFFFDDNTRATFDYGGEVGSFGSGASTSAYLGVAVNVENPQDYKGNTASAGITFSLGEYGVTVGYFWPAGTRPLTSGEPQGGMAGYSPGAQFSVWYAVSNYEINWTSR